MYQYQLKMVQVSNNIVGMLYIYIYYMGLMVFYKLYIKGVENGFSYRKVLDNAPSKWDANVFKYLLILVCNIYIFFILE